MAQEAIDEAGNIWIVDGFDANGNPINPRPKPRAQSKGTIYTPPQDPTKQAAEDRARRDQAMQEEKFAWERQRAAQVDNKPNATELNLAAERKTRATALNSLVQQINRTQELNNQGPGATSGIGGLMDYLPFAENKRFDTAGAQLSQQGLAAFRVPGTGTVSDRDAMMFDRGNLPQASNFDAQNAEILDGLRRRVETEYQALGLPAPQWVQPSVWNQDSNTTQIRASQGSLGNAVTGNTRTRYERNPEIEAQVRAAFLRGASLEELNAITIPAGYGPISPQDYAAGVRERQQGRGNAVTFTIGKDVPLTRAEEFIGSPTGAAIAGLTNAGSFGAVQALAPQYNDLTALNPGSAITGEVLGTIAGTAGLGKLGTAAVERALPSSLAQRILQGGGRKGAFARNLGADATYGGLYGTMTEGDPLKGAGQAALGSAGGQVVGGTLGRAFGGLRRAPGAQELADRGIPLTVGQNMGGMVKAMEDRAAGYPVLGDIIGARRGEGFEAFNRAAFGDAGAPIGARVADTGEEGIDSLLAQTGRAYDDATAGVTVPIDAQFMDDIARVRARGQQLPPDLAARFDKAIQNRIDPITGGPVYYHGSPGKIEGQMRPSQSGVYGPGVYLASNIDDAISYTGGNGIGNVTPFIPSGKFATDRQLSEALKEVDAPVGSARYQAASRLLQQRGYSGISDGPVMTVWNPENLRVPTMTGDTYQQAMRGLKGYKAEVTKPGFEQDYRDALSGAQDVLRGQMIRGGGESVVQGLGRADQAYRLTKVLQDAVGAAKNGTGTGQIQMFTPAQLNTAASRNAKKFGGKRPFADLIDAGQQVLPSQIPDSGTAGRIAQLALPGAIVGGGAGLGAANGGMEGAQTGGLMSLGLLAALAAGGTKGGQKALNKVLFDRPAALRSPKAGRAIGKLRGLFGSAAVPLMLE